MITATTIDRTPFFTDFAIARLLVLELKRLHEEERVSSLAWVIMPDHLHWLLQMRSGEAVSDIMRYVKGRSARQINIALQRQGPVWQRDYYDHAIRRAEDARKLARYIVSNPLRAGLVKEIGDYPLWDAVWLS